MSVGKCPNCGGEVKNGKCLYCDTVVDTFAEANEKMIDAVREVKLAEVARKKHRDNIFLIVLICVIILGVLFFTGLMIAPFIVASISDSSHGYTVTADNNNSGTIEIYREKGRWPSGMYKIGEDIPEGTYLVMTDDNKTSGLFPLSLHTTSEGRDDDNYIDETWADYSRYITLKEPGYLNVSWAIVYDPEKNDIENNPFEHAGMFLVGRDIEPGTYQLGLGNYTDEFSQSSHQSKYAVYTDVDAVAPIIKEKGEYRNCAELILEEGDYLKLENCIVSNKKE